VRHVYHLGEGEEEERAGGGGGGRERCMSITGRKGAVNSSALRLVTVNVQTTREFPYLTIGLLFT